VGGAKTLIDTFLKKKYIKKTISKWIGAPPAKWHRSNMSYSLFRFLPKKAEVGHSSESRKAGEL
jgi:hypothetical protein